MDRYTQIALCLIAFALLIPCSVFGANISWDGGVSGTETNWHVDTNWDGDSKPAPADTARIGLDGADVFVTENEVLTSLIVGSSAGNQSLTILSGQISVTSGVTVGHAAGSNAKLYIKGGELEKLNVGCTYIIAGNGTSSTGTITQTGGTVLCYGRDLRIGSSGNGEYNLVGGILVHSNDLQCWRMGTGAGSAGRFYVSGGSMHIHRADPCAYDGGASGNVVFGIRGSGCTNITLGAGSACGGTGWDYDDADEYTNTLQAVLDSGGISLIKSWGNVDIRNVKFEIGTTNGFVGAKGNTYEFVRIPEANTIYTSGWSIANLDSSYQFKAYVTNYSSYDWVLIECTQIPSYPSMFTFR